MDNNLRVLLVDATTGFYRIKRYKLGDFFGPIDLGLHLSGKYNSLNIGTGLLAGSIFPGSNRLIVNGFSPAWGGFYISSMGGAGLVFDNLGINLISIVGKAPSPTILYLNRIHGEEIEVVLKKVDVKSIWESGRTGIYSLMDHVHDTFGHRYVTDPRILATGPAAMQTDIGGICSVPIKNGKLSFVDTWAGRGGMGSKMVQEHSIVSVIYGGTYIDEDFRNRKVADKWFENRYNQRLAVKDLETTKKYRFDPDFGTGGTFGVNYTKVKGRLLAFNYKTICMSEEERLKIHKNLIVDHYLKQFNEETIEKKQQKNCGEPCSALCKKMNGEYKKDYEPYQTLGPLSGIFDQRAAEKINHFCDAMGFDAISLGGVVAWIMEILDQGVVSPAEIGVSDKPKFNHENFNVVEDSMHNANLGIEIINSILNNDNLDFSQGARKFARKLAREKGAVAKDSFIYLAFGRKGWMVPNQYWTSGVMSPMAIMGKYYMHYGTDFVPPRLLGKLNADRFKKELILDNLGTCRFHRGWAEDMLPEVIDSLYGLKEKFLHSIEITAARINSRNSSIFWETNRNIKFIETFLRRHVEIEGNSSPELLDWIERFNEDAQSAAYDFWYEIHKGIQESLREFK